MGFLFKNLFKYKKQYFLSFSKETTHVHLLEKENAVVFFQMLHMPWFWRSVPKMLYRMRLMTQLRSDLTNCFLCLHLSVWSLWYSLGSLWFHIHLEFRGHHTLNIFLLRAYYSLMNVTRLNIGNKVFPLLPQMVGTGELNLKCHF